MSFFFSLLTFFLPFILIPLLPKTSSQTTYMLASYLIILPASLITSILISSKLKKFENWILKIGILFIILYSLYLFSMSLARYYNFRSEIIDLSYYDHVLYQLSQFKIPHVWDVPQWFVWGDHFDGILFLFVPLYWLKREPAFLMAIQSGLAILTTIPIYLYAKQKFSSVGAHHYAPALAISFSYLLFGSHQMGYLYGFHEIVMFPFFFFWMLYFMETKKTKLFLLFLFLTTIIKEETFLYLIFLGVYYCFKIKNYSIPLLFITTGVLWYIFTFQLIFPHFYPHWNIHTDLYGNLTSIKGILDLLQPYKIGTIINHLAPFGFLPLLYPPSLIVTIPAWLQKLLTNDIASLSGFHYSSALTALLIFASIEALSHYLKLKFSAANVFSAHSGSRRRQGCEHCKKLFANEISIFVILIAFYSNYFLGYQPSSLKNLSLNEFQKTPGQQTAYDFMKEIPSEASVSASYILVPHLKKPTGLIHAVPRNNEDSEYILLNHNISIPLTTASLYKQYLTGLEKNYEILKSQNNIFLLRKVQPKIQP